MDAIATKDTPSKVKPKWLHVPAASGAVVQQMEQRLRQASLRTVCYDAACPNRAVCWQRQHAAFMILGDRCTRRCAFCNVPSGRPSGLPIKTSQNVWRCWLNPCGSNMLLSHRLIGMIYRIKVRVILPLVFGRYVGVVRQQPSSCWCQIF